MKAGENKNEEAVNPLHSKTSSDETHQDLNEFNATKKTIEHLLDYKRSLSQAGNDEVEKIKEIKRKAIDAINLFFDDIIKTSKN